jgi:lipopolysaccharide biosynthesis glycosyltransferase
MPAKQPVTVACAANEGYVIPMTVMLTSIVCNLNPDRDMDIYIIESDIQSGQREKIETSILQNKKNQRVDIHWLKLDKSLIDDLPVAGHVGHITSETYARLLAPDLLPATCHRLVWLDCDVVVLADISALHDVDDDGQTVAAVSNVVHPYVSSPLYGSTVVFNHAELGIPATNRYFQAGVMVVNLDLWRQRNISLRTLHYLKEHQEKVIYHDQGGLNAILHDQWFRLDQRWNQTAAVLEPEFWTSPAYSKEEWIKTKNDPFIVHFAGADKPWHPGSKRPRASFFCRYFNKTLFKDDLKLFTLESKIGFRNYVILWKAKKKMDSILAQVKTYFRGQGFQTGKLVSHGRP